MAKIISDGPLPKKIPGFACYNLPDVPERIIREESGFTKENLKQKHYRKCGENANEFGSVVSMCKKFRAPLNGVIPVANGRQLHNRLTSKMRSLMALDSLSEGGCRNLETAFSLLETRQRIEGYDFNLDAPLPYRSRPFITLDVDEGLTLDAPSFVSELDFPDGSDWAAVRLHRYLFDFKEGQGVLFSSAPLFLNRFTTVQVAALTCAFPTSKEGVLFTLLELKYYAFEGGSYLPLVPDLGTVVHVLKCGE